MRDNIRDGFELSERATLNLLSALEDDKYATQRNLTKRIGVALGLTNSLLKRAVKKGLIKVHQAPAKRFAYYITPKGFREKSRLVGEYLTTSLAFFQESREQYAQLFERAQGLGLKSAALYGDGELAEIAKISADQCGMPVVGLIQPGSNLDKFVGVDVINSLEQAVSADIDVIILTERREPQASYDLLCEHFGQEKVLVPSFLHVSTKNPK